MFSLNFTQQNVSCTPPTVSAKVLSNVIKKLKSFVLESQYTNI